jgi:hypothetical protein
MNNLEIYSIEILNEFVLIENYHYENNDDDDIQVIFYGHRNQRICIDYLSHHLNDKHFVNKKHH